MVKIACRFPVKSNFLLLALLLGIHLSILIVSWVWLDSLYKIALVMFAVFASLYFSIRQYASVTRSNDDLCWSGENWLMQDNQTHYLDLQNTSWITADFCLLKFKSQDKYFAWLFTRKSLGEGLYRELCYLARCQINRPSDPQNS